ncbi:MAG: helix-turn-helix domain-containing protein [bacterium]|nr:helix-turn-helix domain-containing protein [bacterium]
MPNFPDIKQGPITKGNLLKIFYRYALQVIPVVNHDKKIIGFLRKSALIAASGIVENLNTPVGEWIKVNLAPADPQEDFDQLVDTIRSFKYIEALPVMNQNGEIIDTWDKTTLVMAWEGKYDQNRKKEEPALKTEFKSLPAHLAKIERDLILKVINNHQGNINEAAKAMGISPASIRYRIKKLKIDW